MNKFKINLTYKFSRLDNEPQFGLTFENGENYEVYIRWIYFYLGKYLGETEIKLFPYDMCDYLKRGYICKYKSFVFCNDAQRQAKIIYNNIMKKLSIKLRRY